ncbi:hypothetical protein ACVW0P_000356 [Mucilaginibacter sp. UYNi724]
MKLLTINLLFFILPFTNFKESKYQNFVHFVSSRYLIPKSAINNCNWHYAIVKTIVKDRKVINYKILNEAPDDIKKSFKFLIGYQFSNKIKKPNQNLVFCLTIENLKTECQIPKTINYTPSEVLGLVMSTLAHQQEMEPNMVFLLDPIISIMNDSKY